MFAVERAAVAAESLRTGRSRVVRDTLQSSHGYDQRVSVLGYTTQMRGRLRAADAIVTATPGTHRALTRASG